MSYNEEKLTKLKHLKWLAQKTSKLTEKVDSAVAISDGIVNGMNQAPTATQYSASITPAVAVTGSIVNETIGNLLGDDQLAGLTSVGTDDAGNSMYDFIINDVVIGTYTKNTKLSDIMNDINRNGEAGVSISYSETENRFTFTARQAGSNGRIKIDGGLSGALFDSGGDSSLSSGSFAAAYGFGWLQDGETTTVMFRMPTVGNTSLNITKDTPLQDVVNKLNKAYQQKYTFSCNKYTGQIEARDMNGGGLVDLQIKNEYGHDVWFDESKAPPNPFTYGKDAIFTAIAINGTVQPIVSKQVNISVPTRVSQLNNDSKFCTDVDVAAAVAAADHLSRRKVASLEDIDPSADGSDKFIYMVPKTGGKNGDKYDEYMVLDGVLEPVGDWAVDLNGYQLKEEGKGLSANDYTDEDKAKLSGIEVATNEEVAEMLKEVFGSVE